MELHRVAEQGVTIHQIAEPGVKTQQIAETEVQKVRIQIHKTAIITPLTIPPITIRILKNMFLTNGMNGNNNNSKWPQVLMLI